MDGSDSIEYLGNLNSIEMQAMRDQAESAGEQSDLGISVYDDISVKSIHGQPETTSEQTYLDDNIIDMRVMPEVPHQYHDLDDEQGQRDTDPSKSKNEIVQPKKQSSVTWSNSDQIAPDMGHTISSVSTAVVIPMGKMGPAARASKRKRRRRRRSKVLNDHTHSDIEILESSVIKSMNGQSAASNNQHDDVYYEDDQVHITPVESVDKVGKTNIPSTSTSTGSNSYNFDADVNQTVSPINPAVFISMYKIGPTAHARTPRTKRNKQSRRTRKRKPKKKSVNKSKSPVVLTI